MTADDHDFVACPFCGSDQALLLGIEDEGLHELPPAAVVVIQCMECDHHYGFDVAQASEQVHVGLYGFACPEGCPEQGGRHRKL